MPITALPDTTVRLLGSPLTISHPLSLVKELLDNAIDAGATSVEVLVSADTLARIEVRDNGCGIHPDDFASLGRHGHTSKLQSFADLQVVGGSSLGFRGDALASANDLGIVAITTRTLAEPVANLVHLVPGTGGVLKHRKVGAPVGTTVAVRGLYSGFPVRAQVCAKEAGRTLDRIRETLRAHAFARPALRLDLKVLQRPKLAWSYVPKAGLGADVGIKEALLQVFGADAASCCLEHRFSFLAPTGDSGETEERGDARESLVMEVCMIKPDALLSKIPRGRYFAVDRRPVSGSKGTMQKLFSVYRRHLAEAPKSMMNISQEAASQEKKPFICMKIQCPPGSYDVNLEPSKNEVIFENEAVVLKNFESVCVQVYKTGEKQVALAEEGQNSGEGIVANQDENDEQTDPERTILKMEQKAASGYQAPVRAIDAGTGLINDCTHEDDSTYLRTTVPKQNRAIDDSGAHENHETESMARNTLASQQPLHQAVFNQNQKIIAPQPLNPCSISKLNAQANQWVPEQVQEEEHETEQRSSVQVHSAMEIPSSPDSDPLMRRYPPPTRDLEAPARLTHLDAYNANNGNRGGLTPPLSSPMRTPVRIAPVPNLQQRKSASRRRGNQHSLWTPPSSTRKDQDEGEWENRYATNRQQRRDPDGLRQTQISFGGPRRRLPGDEGSESAQVENDDYSIGHGTHFTPINKPNVNLNPSLSPAQQRETNESLLNYEISTCFTPSNPPTRRRPPPKPPNPKPEPRNKETANNPFTSLNSIHVSRDQGAANHNRLPPDQEPIPTTLESSDPRAYLLRRQKSKMAAVDRGQPPKLGKSKNCLLPLESTRVEDQVHRLVALTCLDVGGLLATVGEVARYDEYLDYAGRDGASAGMEGGFHLGLDEAREVEEKLDRILAAIMGEDGGDVKCGLLEVLKKRGTDGCGEGSRGKWNGMLMLRGYYVLLCKRHTVLL